MPRHHAQLAIGTKKGRLVIFNKAQKRAPTAFLKHTRRIMCGAWHASGLLALGAEDRQLSLSNADGDTVATFALKGDPSQVEFVPMSGVLYVAVVVNAKTLALYNTAAPGEPLELSFQPDYGNVTGMAYIANKYVTTHGMA